EETGHSLPAAEHFEKAGDIKKAAIFYDRTYVESTSSKEMSVDHIARFREYSMKAGRFYHETGDYEKAADAFSRVKAFNEAATSALAAGDKMKAAEFYETGREYEKAAEIFRERGNVRRAEQLMAEKYIAENDFVSAGKAYVNAGEFAGAAEYFERAGDYIAAGEAYLKENDYSSAGVMLMKGGQELRAAEAYEKNGDIRQAADIYEKLGDTDKAAALIEEFGDYFDASEMYRKAGQTAKALAALQKVSPSDPQYGMAVFKMAEFFKSQGKLDLAAEKFKQAIGTAEADFGNLEMYYGLATVYESLGRYSEAAGLFKNIQLVDYTFKDSGDRLKACEEKASQTPARTDSASSSGQVSGGTETRTKEASKRYAIMGEIGRGGMGIVYKAKDNNLNRIIALKLLPKSISENPKAVMRFSAEARSAAQLNHTNIVTLYDFQQAGGRSFITMEYVEGATLKKLMGMVDKLAISKALKIVYQCCQGLEYAHRKGIVHRDIKPSNIMISKQNVVKIMDFGLAKMAGDNTLSEAGTISGTLLYMSPEQLVGGKLDKKTDIYSLGLVLYELIAGGHPFAKGDAAYHHTHTVPEPPSALRPEIPENLDRITLKCLEKDPAKRFESALQLALALREVPLG
ncbi:MAG: protein kinase, partial [Nitrospirota bacterium]